MADLKQNVGDISELLEADPPRRREFNRLLAGGAVMQFEAQTDRPDGTLIWIAINAQSLRDNDGRVLFYQ